VPADAVELARLGQPHRPIVRRVASQPPDGGAFVAERVVLADEQDETERVCQIDLAKLSRSCEREVGVPGLERALELAAAWPCDVTTNACSHIAALSLAWVSQVTK
jgi:hypothetical protein